MKSIRDLLNEKPRLGWALFGGTLVIVFLLGLLASAIMERRAEALFVYTPQVIHASWEPRSEIWGRNFPREYQSFIQSADTSFKSKYNGNAVIDMLEIDPRLVVLWAGYGFAKDYNQGRGHYYALRDVWHTLRTGAPVDGKASPMPNTCWTCKSPDVPRLMNEMGVAEFYRGSWETKGAEVINPIGCADCHDAETMNLHISRPALVEAFERRGMDITRATHQEMRSLVCAQCHVEYYFNKNRVPDVPYLTLPWDNGLSVEDVEAYYDAMDFSDWNHKLSRAPMLKAQHPGYEIFLTGVHADRGVACADCHMPYHSEGGQKFTSHKVQSPLNNVASTCQVCHREETEKHVASVYERQDKIIQNRDKLEELLVRAHVEAKKAWDLGAARDRMTPVLRLIRHAQWRWDYAAASHGGSFHSPVEISRIIAAGIVKAQEARIQLSRVLAGLGFNRSVPYPDIATKAKAQAFVGLDTEKMNKGKKKFLEGVLPGWLELAKKREATYPLEKYHK